MFMALVLVNYNNSVSVDHKLKPLHVEHVIQYKKAVNKLHVKSQLCAYLHFTAASNAAHIFRIS